MEKIIGIDHAVDVLSRDGSIEHRQLEELLTIQSFRARATYPNDAQCIADISPDAEGMEYSHERARPPMPPYTHMTPWSKQTTQREQKTTNGASNKAACLRNI